MQYYFIFGNTPTLSFAELQAYFARQNIGATVVVAHKDFAIFDCAQELPERIMHELGGSIKYGQVVEQFSTAKQITADWFVDSIAAKQPESKYHFGFSVYPHDKQLAYYLRGVGLEIKKQLKTFRIASRLVMSRQENLSSVVVQKNKLVSDNGWEVVVLHAHDTFYIGKTIAVQPFEEFSQRDYGRPDRDDFSGMLPPKLALSMINLAAQPIDVAVLDPFCGSGTVVQEALLLGYTHIYASDKSDKAVHDTRENVQWLADKKNIAIDAVVVRQHDATLAFSFSEKINAIVTEPFLGPAAQSKRSKQEGVQIVRELQPLYEQALRRLSEVLAQGGRIVMVFPVLFTGGGQIFLSDNVTIPDSITPVELIPREFHPTFRLTRDGGILYSRPGQHVGREMLVFEKK